MRVSRKWSHFDTIGGVVIVGIHVAIICPQFTDTGPRPHSVRPALESRLQTIRSQIELYNVQNPETRYDATTPVGPAFWAPLLRGYYLQMAPDNPFQNGSTVVGATPAMGTGWVWAETSAGDPWTLNVYAVDERGNLYDGDQDGSPD